MAGLEASIGKHDASRKARAVHVEHAQLRLRVVARCRWKAPEVLR